PAGGAVMTLGRRLEALERQVEERAMWAHHERIVAELGISRHELWEQATRLSKELDGYRRAGMSEEQAMRCYSQAKGYDADEILAEMARLKEEHGAAVGAASAWA
ncbi:MAG: hypothetical protein WBD55_02600, partial [Dehalococcoidia bacterium]